MPLKWWKSKSQSSRSFSPRPRSTSPLLSVSGRSPYGGDVEVYLYDNLLRFAFASGNNRDFPFKRLASVHLDLPEQNDGRGSLVVYFDQGEPIETTGHRFIYVYFDEEATAQFQDMYDEISDRIDD